VRKAYASVINKKIKTIEELAVMVEMGFRMFGKHFEWIDARLDRLEKSDERFREDIKEIDTCIAVIALQLCVSALEKKVDLSPGKL
jgi:hypothetical protein